MTNICICSFYILIVLGKRNKRYQIPTSSTTETFKTKYFHPILFIDYLLNIKYRQIQGSCSFVFTLQSKILCRLLISWRARHNQGGTAEGFSNYVWREQVILAKLKRNSKSTLGLLCLLLWYKNQVTPGMTLPPEATVPGTQSTDEMTFPSGLLSWMSPNHSLLPKREWLLKFLIGISKHNQV